MTGPFRVCKAECAAPYSRHTGMPSHPIAVQVAALHASALSKYRPGLCLDFPGTAPQHSKESPGKSLGTVSGLVGLFPAQHAPILGALQRPYKAQIADVRSYEPPSDGQESSSILGP